MKHVIKEIQRRISETADKSLQRKLWLNQNNDTGLISSFTELYCSIFDDYALEAYINYDEFQEEVPADAIIELKKLLAMMKNYVEGEKCDREIIEDTEWNKVVQQAKHVLVKWPLINYKYPTDWHLK